MKIKKPKDEEEAKLILESMCRINAAADGEMESVSLADVHDTYKKWFHIQDTNRLDIVLAVILSQKEKGVPLWLIIVAPSGDMKSEQLRAFDDDGKTVKIVPRMTDKTLVNGHQDKQEYPDFAPKLNNKVMMILDMAEILQLRSEVKTEVWAQLRTLYDGEAGAASGMGMDVYYKGLYITFLAGSTPVIDDQILIHQSLGSRELIYRPKEIVDVGKLMERAWENECFEEMMRQEIKVVCQEFIKTAMLKEIIITEAMKKKIMKLTVYLTKMRAAASIDSYSGDLRSSVTPERPTRLLKQLKRLYCCLKCLDVNYTDEKALEIVEEVVMSSVIKNRQNVLDLLIKEKKKLSTSEIADKLKIGKKTAKQELNILWNMEIIFREPIEFTTNWGETKIIQENWWINDSNETIKFLLKVGVDEESKDE